MGKVSRVRILTFTLAALTFVAGSGAFGGELIEPTRTLWGPEKGWGGLTVFSEPPQMEVYLDGEKVGTTPLWLRHVDTGRHTLQIAGAEKEVTVEKGKVARTGLFKGSFVTFSQVEEEKAAPRSPKEAETQPPATPQPPEETKSEELSLWQRYVNGSLNHF